MNVRKLLYIASECYRFYFPSSSLIAVCSVWLHLTMGDLPATSQRKKKRIGKLNHCRATMLFVISIAILFQWFFFRVNLNHAILK